MQDSDREDLDKETLERQFELVRREVTTSPVHQFGDLDVATLPVGDFQGLAGREGIGEEVKEEEGENKNDPCLSDAVDSRTVAR